ncbi:MULTISPECIES: Rv3654c family TadE-like protein [unclassified Nocardiopsis]|uniref:Rv3654c family TadE-like protein n=1 Tax=unclassified Nocardiopsis TaxID=2649073 RepID=UPI00135CC7D3|nr:MULTISPECIES: Rv3654c family TadE-like protein [unclassified Nocardiopsis]
MRSDSGSATVWWAALGALLWLAALAVLAAAAARLDRDRATAAADLAALAAASRALQGTASACAGARVTAEANGAHLEACDLTGLTVTVAVSVPSSLADRPVTARARAGPVSASPGPGSATPP